MPRPTIRDVAAAAGVSPTTVSHALNRKGRVDPRTRAQVERAAERLGYLPNRNARSLSSGRSGQLALLLPVAVDARSDVALTLDYYMRLACAAAATAFEQDHALLLVPPLTTIDGLRAFPVDGALVVDPTENDVRVDLVRSLEIPCVTIEHDPDHPDDPWYVASENHAATLRMLDHLADRGAHRVAMLVPDAHMGWVSEALRAYREWTTERAAWHQPVTVPLEGAEQGARVATMRLLDQDRPDAIIAVAERHTHGMLAAVDELGLSCPKGVLLAAGVDGHAAREWDPAVTALDLQPERQARAAVEMLLARLEDVPVEAPQHIPAILRPRASTAARGAS